MLTLIVYFSKFITPDSIRVEINFQSSSQNVVGVGFDLGDSLRALVIYSWDENAITFDIRDTESPRFAFQYQIESNSIATIVYKKP